MKWSKEAEEAVSCVPFFVRKRVKRRVEEEAVRCGAKEVNLEHVTTCQKRFLSRMEEEVKGYQVEACFGSSGCPNRAVIDEELLTKLETLLSEKDLKSLLKERVKGPLKMHHEFRVCISDCPNACSRPQIVDVGLIGACLPEITEETCSECGACVSTCKENAIALQDGCLVIDPSKCLFCAQCVRACPTGTLKEGKRGYRILVGGKLGRHPRLARELPGIHSPEETLSIVERCTDVFRKQCVGGERFGEILERSGKEPQEILVAGDTCDSYSPSLEKATAGT
jgi:dissimilatory sulfite reductase (desulfoviridin) alpha/beta subunit